MSDILPNTANYCSFIFSYRPAERASITNITLAAEMEVSLAVGGKFNRMYYDPTQL